MLSIPPLLDLPLLLQLQLEPPLPTVLQLEPPPLTVLHLELPPTLPHLEPTELELETLVEEESYFKQIKLKNELIHFF